jgi:hypothetical protein
MASDPSPSQKPKSSSNYLKYSSLGIQLLAAIGFFGWLGYLLDRQLRIQFPAFMLTLGFLAFGGMMFQVYRSIKRDNN